MTLSEQNLAEPTRRSATGALVMMLVAMVFLFVDVRIGGLELVLPDYVGYVLMAFAFNRLAPADKRFRRARLLAAVLVVVSLLTFFEKRAFLAEHGSITYTYNQFWPAEMSALVLDMAMIWLLARGLREVALRRARFSLAEPALVAGGMYAAVAAIRLAGMAVYLLVPQMEFYLMIPLTAFQVVAALLMLDLVWSAWRRNLDLFSPREGAGNQ